MHTLASIYPCPCTLARHTIINKGPFGAQTEPTRGSAQGLGTRKEALKDMVAFDNLLYAMWVKRWKNTASWQSSWFFDQPERTSSCPYSSFLHDTRGLRNGCKLFTRNSVVLTTPRERRISQPVCRCPADRRGRDKTAAPFALSFLPRRSQAPCLPVTHQKVRGCAGQPWRTACPPGLPGRRARLLPTELAASRLPSCVGWKPV
ncbi:uncharacterized protein LOC107196301 [Pteropus alecto]|uniref:uncharacterized protein LOC107196301 n=1 Tax=Pteropus alecto TaxID=9402 RepID=UPI000D538D52|nr:uncharacterized protein LOC107196301 [Pteropus alecto]